MKKITAIFLLLVILVFTIYVRLQPLRHLNSTSTYTGTANLRQSRVSFDSSKKTVVVMADNNMTELFDMMAPFYLFSETGKANVFIAAQRKYPIATKNGPLVMPHFSFGELDSLGIQPDIIVIPFMDAPESNAKISWLRKHFSERVVLLSICDGAWTAAASGLFDGKPLTSHATGHSRLREKFSGPHWVQQLRYTESGNLFSTGGVSNAVDGSLAVIGKEFGKETMLRVMRTAHYPNNALQTEHSSIAINTGSKLTAIRKMLFRKSELMGVVLQNNANELELAAVYDVYNRSLPRAIQTILPGRLPVTSRHGLTLFTTDTIVPGTIDEIHLLSSETVSKMQRVPFTHAKLVSYNSDSKDYIIDICLAHIGETYGASFQQFVKRTMDYN